ncbi:type II toxin-antitoxin system HipA family toxin [Lysobacter sp. Root604]|uniref:type II toxin-antitoxin system HipA family toxin n=1 Tax=Lysobacter sp. Root604 TaxID=1736568 RepID=UPI0006F1FFE1|nr:toxin HipA [Lysobacter sp. Root604]
MARAKRSGALTLWMNGERVGLWRNAHGEGQELVYDPAWLASPRARPLSLSLPFTPANAPHRGDKVRHYFENLLPDSQKIRERLAAKYGATSQQAFDLLREIGRDCVGALQLMPEGETPQDVRAIHGKPLDEAEIEQLLRDVVRPDGAANQDHDTDFRISIAGAQEKTALLWHQDRWQRPLGATPSTHIFKLPLGLVGNLRVDLRDSVENEWLCSRVLHAYGIPVAECRMMRFGDQQTLVVRRFDRELAADGRWIVRIPQEDFCQVLGQPAWRKYEADGGPGMADILRVLANSVEREADRETFYRAQLLFWMLAATDGHAKNFSVFIGAGGSYRMTPLYDVLSAWPVTGASAGKIPQQKLKMAMAVRSKSNHYRIAEIQRRHWNAMARSIGLGMDFESQIADIIDATPRAIAQVERELPADFPAYVADAVLGGLRRSAEKLALMPAT